MTYAFLCPHCGERATITMRISEYTADGHICPRCGGVLIRDPKDFGTNYSVKCDGFYAEHQSH